MLTRQTHSTCSTNVVAISMVEFWLIGLFLLNVLVSKLSKSSLDQGLLNEQKSDFL